MHVRKHEAGKVLMWGKAAKTFLGHSWIIFHFSLPSFPTSMVYVHEGNHIKTWRKEIIDA